MRKTSTTTLHQTSIPTQKGYTYRGIQTVTQPSAQPSLPMVPPESRHVGPGDGGSFFFGNYPVRTIVKDGEVWFVAKDVAEILGYTDTDQAIRQHCKTATTSPVEITGQVRHIKIIPERDVNGSS